MKYRRLDLSMDWKVLRSFYIAYWGISFEEADEMLNRLPKDGIVAEDGVMGIVGCVFLYMMANSNTCITAFPVLSKEFKGDRELTIRTMFEKLHTIAEYSGYSYIQTWSGLPFVQRHLSSLGYELGDEAVNHYIKPLK